MTKKQITKYIESMIEKLGLTDWYIVWEFAHVNSFCTVEGVRGACHYDRESRQATIVLSAFKADEEETKHIIRHELLHVLLVDLTCFTLKNSKELVKEAEIAEHVVIKRLVDIIE